MEKIESFNIGIAVYNEGRNIEKTMKVLFDSLSNISFKGKPHIYICFNGCTDNTISSFLIQLRLMKKFFKISILSSKKGKLKAHREIVSVIQNYKPILFLDADIFVNSYVIKRLVSTLRKDNKLQVVSAYPYAIKPKNLNFYQKLLFPIINLKRIIPQIEIAKNDVSIFHPNAKSDFERKSRIYFHGRCFIIRNKFLYSFPTSESGVIGDDTFLSFYFLQNFPPGSIKVLYDAPVYSYPQLSVVSYLKSWYRIRKDLENIYKSYPNFKPLRKYVEMKMNWQYVLRNLSLKYKIDSMLFFLLRCFEVISYRLLRQGINADKIWNYKCKEENYEHSNS